MSIKTYEEWVYLVLEVNSKVFDNIDDSLVSSEEDGVKFLLGNEKEIKYVESIIGHHKEPDYYKFIRVGS